LEILNYNDHKAINLIYN